MAARSLTAPDVAGATLAILSLCIDVARGNSPSEQRSPEKLGTLYGDLILRMLGATPRLRVPADFGSAAPPTQSGSGESRIWLCGRDFRYAD